MGKVRSGLLPVAGGFSQMISAGFEDPKDPTTGKRGNRRQFRLKLAIDESYGPPQARRALAVARLADITAMRKALVKVGRGAQAAYLMRKAAAVAGDEEKFNFAIAAANVVMSRPREKTSEASSRFVTWGQLARAWCSQELARLYPNAGYGKKSAEATDEPRVEYLCKFIENVPLATFNDDDYWRAMRPARAHCKTDSTFRAYAQVCRRVVKIGVELRIIPAWPLSAVCKLPILAKGEAPEFPFLYPEEYARLMRCGEISIDYRVLWGFIIREGLRLGEAFRIRWEHLELLPPMHGMPARWVLNVPATKTGRALMFVLMPGTGEVLEAFKRLRPELAGPFVWLTATNYKKAAHDLRRHIEISGTERERLLFTAGRLRRLREHDLRSTFVSWCKLAGIDNETIAQHTGHESNTMIARYNRSKATIEHLGLAPYLPLDQAMGLDVAGELDAAVLAAGPEPRQLAAGEPTTEVGAQPTSVPATGGRSCNPLGGGEPLQATAIDNDGPGQGPASSTPGADLPGARLPAPQCPECERPLARVQAGKRSGWACVSCNAAGEPEGDWLDPVTSPLHPPRGPANGEATPAGAYVQIVEGYAPGALLAARFAAQQQGSAGQRDGVDYADDGGADLVHRDSKPLNARNECDPECDHALAGECSTAPENEKSSMFDAECARGGSNSHTVRCWNLNPAFGDRRKQNPANPGGEPVPEATGSDRGSHPGVTTPATPLELLQAAGQAYYDKRNWTALRALEPLIDAEVARLAEAARAAEVARLAEAARAAPPAPVRLEVVRAQRKGAS